MELVDCDVLLEWVKIVQPRHCFMEMGRQCGDGLLTQRSFGFTRRTCSTAASVTARSTAEMMDERKICIGRQRHV